MRETFRHVRARVNLAPVRVDAGLDAPVLGEAPQLALQRRHVVAQRRHVQLPAPPLDLLHLPTRGLQPVKNVLTSV